MIDDANTVEEIGRAMYEACPAPRSIDDDNYEARPWEDLPKSAVHGWHNRARNFIRAGWFASQWRSPETAPLNKEILAWVDPGEDDFSTGDCLRIVSCTGATWADWDCTKRYGWKLICWMPAPDYPDVDDDGNLPSKTDGASDE